MKSEKEWKCVEESVCLVYIQQGPIIHLLMKIKFHTLKSLLKSFLRELGNETYTFTICTYTF